jgi:VIT1/CCC1 family predicted Fe2+/Mn2+ transporter
VRALLSRLEDREKALDLKAREANATLKAIEVSRKEYQEITRDAAEMILGMKTAVRAFAKVSIQDEVTACLRDELDGLSEAFSEESQKRVDIESKRIIAVFEGFTDLLMGFTNLINGGDEPTLPENVAAMMHRARQLRLSQQQRKAGNISAILAGVRKMGPGEG